MKRGFTLIEMLVVIGIIAILIGASIAGFTKMTRTADRARAQELVSNVATALSQMFLNDGCWPQKLIDAANADGRLDENVALVLAKKKCMSLTVQDGKLAGLDRFGIVTPWATDAIKRAGNSGSSGSINVGGRPIAQHVLYFAIDLDGDGITEIKEGGSSLRVRATACVWCCDKDGSLSSVAGAARSGKGGIFSYTAGQIAQ